MNRRVKNYWEKRREVFKDGSAARSRASLLRACEQVSHVLLAKERDEYLVTYSVARWFVEEMQKSGIEL